MHYSTSSTYRTEVCSSLFQIEGRQKLDSISKRKSMKPSELEKSHNFKVNWTFPYFVH